MSQETKIDAAIIKKTQDTLGRIIQAPSLTEKLLNRPPVQFIQDIVKSVIKTTSFMKGLYSAEELDGAYLKASKENKILFLNKLVVIVGLGVGEQLSVKPSKIAAGSEAEKTNELLQLLAKAINMKPDNDELVKKALKKLKTMDEPEEKEEKPREKERDKEKKSDKDRDREKDKEKEKDNDRDKERGKERERDKDKEKRDKDKERDRDRDRERDKDKDREREREKDKEKERDKDKERHREKERERDKDKESRDKDKSKDKERERDKNRDKESHRDDREKSRNKDKARERDREENKETSKSSNRHKEDRDSSAGKSKMTTGRRNSKDQDEIVKESRNKHDKYEDDDKRNNNDDDNDVNTSRRRPSSARGPRVQIERDDSQNKAQIDQDDNKNLIRPTTARPGAPRPRLTNEPEEPAKLGLNSSIKSKPKITSKGSDSDDDFVVKENKFQDDDKKNFSIENELRKRNQDLDEDDENHGALVKKILESKEQLEYGSELNKNKGEFQKPIIQMDMQRKKEKERVQKEIDKLKESIQTLTKASIPLGRTLDFLQEDIDMMQKEIVKWSDEYEQNTKALKRQQAESQSFLEPYKAALGDIESQIEEQSEKISNVKRKILLNEEKISKLIFNIGKN